MRNLKSMVAFLVVAAMLFASFTTFAYNDVAADADYASAVEVLSALEILKGDDKGNFNPDNTITRAEAAAVIVRTLGWEEAAKGAAGATQFTDVAADHWGSGYINMAAQAGIIAGHGDGTFGPEDPVTYEQIVKMLVCALGYEPKALTKGAYPTGYLITANEAKLTAGVSGAAGQEAPRKIVAQLTFNALDIPMMTQEGWGSDISYVINDGKKDRDYRTLLTEQLGMVKVYGTIEKVVDDREAGTTAFKIDAADKANVYVLTADLAEDLKDGTNKFFAKNIDVSGALNLKAYAYLLPVDEKAAKYELIALATVGAEDSVTLAFADFDFDGTTFTWNDEKDEADVSAETKYYLNGEDSTKEAVKALFKALNIGSATLVLDAEDDEKVAAVYVDYSATAIVKSVSAEKSLIRLEKAVFGTSKIDLDTEKKENEFLTYTLKDDKGNDVAVADLKENDILTVKASKDLLNWTIVVSTATVEGKIVGSKKVDGVDNWKIGDDYYVAAPEYLGDALKTTLEGIFYLNTAGQIATMEAFEATENYVVLYQATISEDGETLTLSAFGKDGTATYTIAADSAAYYEGTKYGKNGEAVSDLYKVFEALLPEGYSANTAKYEFGKDLNKALLLNIEAKDGKVSKITKLAVGEAVEGTYYESSKSFDKSYFLNNALVLKVTKDAETVSDFEVVSVDNLVDEAKYTYYTIADADAAAMADLVVITVDGEAAGKDTNPIAIITGVSEGLDEDDLPAAIVTYLSEGEEVEILVDTDVQPYAVGDVIILQKTTDGKLAKDCKVIGKLADAANTHGDNFDLELTSALKKREVVYGSVHSIVNDQVTLNVVAKGTKSYVAAKDKAYFMLADVDTMVYEVKKNGDVFVAGDAFDLEANEYDEDDKTFVFHYAVAILDDEGNLVNLIILVPEIEKVEGEEVYPAGSDHAGTFTDADLTNAKIEA